MTKKLLLFFFFSFSLIAWSQVTNEGEPESWNLLQQKSSITPIILPSIDLDKIKKEDEITDSKGTKEYRISFAHPVNYNISNAGTWTELSNGDRIWRVLFHSKDALHLSVVFDKFYIPEGANLYLYSNDRDDLQGAYTNKNNNAKNQLGTWFVQSDKLWIEYYEPKEVKGKGKLQISDVMHGYRLGHSYQKGYFGANEKGLNDSGICNHDVDCPIGNDFEANKDILKKSVAFIIIPDPGVGTFVCTGSLINNTAQDKEPYFLTANHCYDNNNGTIKNPALSSMRFNWISPNPICGSATNSTDATVNQTMNGATLRARRAGSDFMLLEFNSNIPDTWDVIFAGWDKTDTTPTYQVGIHHPRGDIMKICRDNNPATKVLQFGVQTWDINGLTNGGNSGNSTGWEIGVTEGGSSGSALYNQNGHIIGQLLGGLAACSGTNDNNAHDYYGRFATSWSAGTSSTSRLREWLDPGNLNPNTLDVLQNVLSTNDEVLEQNITMFPNPTTGLINIKISNEVGELNYEVFNLLGQKLKSDSLQSNESIDLSDLPNSIYLVKLTDTSRNATLTKKVVLNK